jgi:tetratricopeptide (TPR) repeat protein
MRLTDEQINFIKEHLKVAGEQTLPLLLDTIEAQQQEIADLRRLLAQRDTMNANQASTIEALQQEKLRYLKETSNQLGKEIVRVGELQQEISRLKTAINAQGKEIIKRGTDNVKLQRENEWLQYNIIGIMHSVDKWFDEADENMDEVNRAAQAREIALQAIEKRDEALKAAREALETVAESLENCYGRDTLDTIEAREVIAAIDEIGGWEDEI